MFVVKIKANAKINISLSILGKREDGYHLIDTVMHSVGLYDEISLKKSEKISVICEGLDVAEQENIAYRAAKLFFETFGISGGAEIVIQKHIPAAAGLGGGSADAAAVLLGLNKLYSVNAANVELRKVALKLGADVPFFIEGGCQRCEGIGELLTPVKPLSRGYVLLAKAEEKPSTAEMYRILDSKKTVFCDTNAVINAIKSNDLYGLSDCMSNSFEQIWEQSVAKDKLLKFEPLKVSLSGSGPTWFALFEDKDKALKAEKILIEEGMKCFVCEFSDRAIEIE